ncbi:hypothetical protein COC42_08070 [Sphingomonas spermidinifaciens]|uniref:GGDEF domain-containing protein n=1 Tax=Sphingomonas spermidinifaciens TaxID=1141889 RepID=A0A2A4B8F8_9SPHN|nr:sensor domain-containing diguanylate cyclase [Sphingomonas spermidinifaciens]PCD04232.1 hypothetical protein COC42_08070 [Sphingomonas spermidinifaciens]
MNAHPPFDEAHRLRVLDALGLIGAAPQAEFKALAALAARLIGTDMAALTLIDATHQHVMASHNIDAPPLPRGESFCDKTLGEPEMLVSTDAAIDARFAGSVLVREAPHLRFYAGVPIRVRAGGGPRAPIGAICVLGTAPRDISADQCAALIRLGRVAEALIDARGAARDALTLARRTHEQATELVRKDRIFRQAERMAMIGSWRFDPVAETVEWSEGVRRIHEVGEDYRPNLATALDFYPANARAIVSGALAHSIETGEPFEYEVDFDTAQGQRLRVRGIGEVERAGGRTIAVTGVFQDVTARYLLEQDLRRSAHVDALTGIANRAAFDQRLEAAIDRARRDGMALTLILVDLDGFKRVNDTHGHMAGDDVLRAHGRRLRGEWQSDCFPARLGGDEFALVLEGAATRDMGGRVARLLDLLARPIALGEAQLRVGGTIGWATFEPGMANPRDLIHAADTALYNAKRERRGTARAASA